MKERPILFSAPMVRAILEGRKTQTRRLVRPQPPHDCSEIEKQPRTDPYLGCVVSGDSGIWEDVHSMDYRVRCPYGKPGDRLWVRETWRVDGLDRRGALMHGKDVCMESGASFYADCECDSALADGPWIPSIHMPRWASRITLEIVNVRIERLQDISEEDAIAEGIRPVRVGLTDRAFEWDSFSDATYTANEAYAALWESINGPGSWDANPWVWVVEFRRVDK